MWQLLLIRWPSAGLGGMEHNIKIKFLSFYSKLTAHCKEQRPIVLRGHKIRENFTNKNRNINTKHEVKSKKIKNQNAKV
jgi:hypothetical protein